MTRALVHRPDAGWEEITDLSTLSEVCRTPGWRLWIEVDVTTDDAGVIEMIGEELGFHPLAVEDAARARQRPKLEEYESRLFAIVHQLDVRDEQLEAFQISCFIGPRYALTVHEGAERILGQARSRLLEGSDALWRGSASLMHTLLDTIVDDYERIAGDLEEQIEHLEEVALEGDPRAPVRMPLYSIKQRLSRLRRYVLPVEMFMASVVEPSMHRFIGPEVAAYFRDIHDHTQRIVDQLRNVDDLADALIELVRAQQAADQNEVTKRLTAWAAIIAIPTFIASIYGMNFRLVPADGQLFGFWFALATMAASSGTLYLYFRHRGWI